jgi:hypothetical protein
MPASSHENGDASSAVSRIPNNGELSALNSPKQAAATARSMYLNPPRQVAETW